MILELIMLTSVVDFFSNFLLWLHETNASHRLVGSDESKGWMAIFKLIFKYYVLQFLKWDTFDF